MPASKKVRESALTVEGDFYGFFFGKHRKIQVFGNPLANVNTLW
jgi:hypothetical protein